MKINLGQRPVLTLYASQYDTGNLADFEIYNNGIPYAPDTATIRGMKPSGEGFSVAGSVSGNTVIVEMTEVMTDEAGRFPVEIRLEKDGALAGSVNIDFWVERAPEEGGVT